MAAGLETYYFYCSAAIIVWVLEVMRKLLNEVLSCVYVIGRVHCA